MTERLIELLTQQQAQQAQQLEEFRKNQLDTNKQLVELLGRRATTEPEHVSTAIPNFAAFDPNAELLSDYMDRFKTFVAAHSIPTEKQPGVFLTNQSPTLYKMLSNMASQLNPPRDINELSLPEIEAFLKQQYDPAQYIIRERHKFWSDMTRKPGEKISELAARIRQDATTCAFTDIQDPLDEAMRTRFMCSVSNEAVLKALFKVKPTELTFTKAIQIATETEDAANVAKETVHGATPKLHTIGVNKVKGGKFFNKHRKSQSNHTQNYHNSKNNNKPCFRCDLTNHTADECKNKEAICNYCKIKGHIERACKKKKGQGSCKPIRTKATDTVKRVGRVEQLMHTVILNGKPTKLELDTGAEDSFITQSLWEQLGSPTLEPCDTRYESASGDVINTLGACQLSSRCHNAADGPDTRLHYVVSDVPNLNILGRKAIQELGVSVDQALLEATARPHIHTIKEETPDHYLQQSCKQLIQEFPDLFKDELGCLKGFELEVKFRQESQPVYCKPRPVPFALMDDLNHALDVGIAKGIWEPVQFNDYGTPVVPVRKPGGKIRVCGDYSKTVNPQLEPHRQPLPLPEDLIRKLGGGHGYTKIDLADAYNQITLAPASQRKLALSTHRGVLLQKRLPFGITSAPGYFQQIMNQLTNDLPGVAVYLDDILVSGTTAEEHINNLRRLLQRLDEHNLRCNLSKCQFAAPVVDYLGHRLTAHGLEKGKKVDAVQLMPAPNNVTELRSFLGSVQFYRKFLPNLSDATTELNKLLKKGEKWHWGPEQQRSFDGLKSALSDNTVLAHYDPALPIGIACDASERGLGVTLFHRYPDGNEKAIDNVSKTLTETQQRYGQIQKEALSIIYGLKKFHQYLYGREFILVTDHEPLVAMLGPKKGVPALAANRLARWALLLNQYQYTVEYRPTKKHGNADALSRLPAGPDPKFDEEEDAHDADTVLAIKTIGCQLMSSPNALAKETGKDAVLAQVMKFTTEGWPLRSRMEEGKEEKMDGFRQIADSLTIMNDCLLYGNRVVIPQSLKKQVLQILHTGHFGMQRMKQLARTAVYWPGIDADIETMCRQCADCGENQNRAPKYPVHPWMMPEKPWSRVHIDHAINFMGNNYLVIIDAYSKYPIIKRTTSTSTKATTDILEEAFAHFGYPHAIVSDNATTFTSGEFKEWCKERGIAHLTGAPFHPATNGAAERLIQTFKQSMRKSNLPPNTALQEFLMQYRRTPLPTGFSPSQLLNGRQIRCKIDTLLPSPAHVAQEKQSSKQNDEQPEPSTTPQLHGVVAKLQAYPVGTACYTLYFGRHHSQQPRWVPAVVTKVYGPRSVNVRVVPKGPIWRRHVEQLRLRHTSSEDDEPGYDSTSDPTITEPSTAEDQGDSREAPSATSTATPRKADGMPGTAMKRNPRWPREGIDRDNPRRSERLKMKATNCHQTT
jgi:transposase InsO family protein